MKRYATRLMALILFLCVGVFIGMEMTQVGIERVQGPLGDTVANLSLEEPSAASEAADSAAALRDKKDAQLAIEDKELAELEQRIKALREQKREEGSKQWNEEEVTKLARELQAKQNELSLSAAEDAPVNKLADQTAGLLQNLSEAGIKAVVGLFGGLF